MKKSVFFVNGVCSANSQAKRPSLLAGMAALLLSFGLVLTGCGDDDGGTGGTVGENLPAATGVNELSGKTYFVDEEKIEFAKSGTYKKFAATRDANWNIVYDSNEKYTYTEIENGSYSWSDTSKTVTLKPAKIAAREGYGYSALMDAAGYKEYQKKQIDDLIEEMGQEEALDYLANVGVSDVDAFIDYMVNEDFANTTFAYALVADGAALLLSEELPSNVGANELNGKTFNKMVWDNEQRKDIKDTNQTYVFSATGYTYTNSSYTNDNATGTYAWNTDATWGKQVYLKPVKIDNKTNVQYFDSLSGYSAGYNSATDYRAAETNGRFASVSSYTYNLKDLTIN